jgi:hypothetical protein
MKNLKVKMFNTEKDKILQHNCWIQCCFWIIAIIGADYATLQILWQILDSIYFVVMKGLIWLITTTSDKPYTEQYKEDIGAFYFFLTIMPFVMIWDLSRKVTKIRKQEKEQENPNKELKETL